jgi:hypothetical protein
LRDGDEDLERLGRHAVGVGEGADAIYNWLRLGRVPANIVERWGVLDQLGLFQQLGLNPA